MVWPPAGKPAVASCRPKPASLGRSWLEKHARVPEPVPPLFHYTGAEGIKGILESNRMWATGAQHMNDWSEVAYGHGIMTESLRATLSATRLSARRQRVFSAVSIRSDRSTIRLSMPISPLSAKKGTC